MPTDLDALMDLDPLSLSDRDIDAIIAYHRNNRAREGADGKMAKPKGTATKAKLDLADLIKGIAEPAPKVGGIRRV